MNKITVAIRTKNQVSSLSFLLDNLESRYLDDIDEVIVLDNCSNDGTKDLVEKYRFVKYALIDNFSYGGSANLIAELASNDLIVIFSAHAYPISWDFFKIIKSRFDSDDSIAGLRCLNYDGDFRYFINKFKKGNTRLSAEEYNMGVIFCGSCFNKKIWEKIKFDNDIVTFEDKDWSKKVLSNGYIIEMIPAIFCYNIKRNKDQLFFRFKNELLGSIQTHSYDLKFINVLKMSVGPFINLTKNYIIDVYYQIKRVLFLLKIFFRK